MRPKSRHDVRRHGVAAEITDSEISSPRFIHPPLHVDESLWSDITWIERIPHEVGDARARIGHLLHGGEHLFAPHERLAAALTQIVD